MFEMTTLCYIEKDNKYLMLHRIKKENDSNRDKWIGVGGHFEENESPEDCMKREVYEETGLTVTSWDYRGIVTFVQKNVCFEYMHLFVCKGFEGNVTECDEGALEWIDKKKLLSLPMWEGDKVFLSLLDSDCGFFSLKLVYDGDHLTETVLNGKSL